MTRQIDHLVLATRDLDAAAAVYRRLGFQVGSRNLHPWGTENHIVQFTGGFLELIGFAADFQPPAEDDPVAPFAHELAAYLSRREGLGLVALRSESAEADAAAFVSAGIGTGRMLHFGRSSEAADGSLRKVSFTLAFTTSPWPPGQGIFVCQQHQPENFWHPAMQIHPNGARGITGVTLVARDPAASSARLGALFGPGAAVAGTDSLRFAAGDGAIEVLTLDDFARTYGMAPGERDDADAFAAATVAVESLEAVGERMVAEGLFFEVRDHRLIVPNVFGLTLVFEPVVPRPIQNVAPQGPF